MQRFFKKLLIASFLVSFAVPAEAARPRIVVVSPAKAGGLAIKDSISRLYNYVVSHRPTWLQAVAGAAAAIGLCYGISKFMAWLTPLNEYLLAKPAQRYLSKPTTLDDALALFQATSGKKEGQYVSGAILEDHEIVTQCRNNSRFRQRMLAHTNLKSFSRVGIIDVDEVAQLTEQDKKTIKALQAEAAHHFKYLINPAAPKKSKQDSGKPTTKQPKHTEEVDRVAQWSLCLGRLIGILETRKVQQQEGPQQLLQDVPENVKVMVFNQVYQTIYSQFNGDGGEAVLLGDVVLTSNKAGQQPKKMTMVWCSPQVRKLIEHNIERYNARCDVAEEESSDINYEKLFVIMHLRGQVYGAIETIGRDYGIDLPQQLKAAIVQARQAQQQPQQPPAQPAQEPAPEVPAAQGPAQAPAGQPAARE